MSLPSSFLRKRLVRIHRLAPLTCLLWLVSAGVSAQADPTGEDVFVQQKCNLCHGAEAAGIASKAKSEKLRATDLSDVAGRREESWLTAFLHREEPLDGKEHKKEWKGTDEELATLIAWLQSLGETAEAAEDGGEDSSKDGRAEKDGA